MISTIFVGYKNDIKMKTQFKQVRFNVLPEMEEQIQKRIRKDNSSFTIIIMDALRLYLASEDIKKDMESSPSIGVLAPADLEAIRDLFKTEGVFSHPPTQFIMKEEPIQKGLIIPEMKERVRPDPDIKNSFHLSHEIRPGDGVVGRLRAAGIDPLEITKARRNKRAGRDYDKSLEQYFDLL